jgi:hypothetical protein
VTFALAYAGERFALVAGDMRWRMREWDDSSGTFGPHTERADGATKVLRLTCGGWLTFCGMLLPHQWLRHIGSIRTSGELHEHLTTPRRDELLQRCQGNEPATEAITARAMAWVVRRSDDCQRFTATAYNVVDGWSEEVSDRIVTVPPADWVESDDAFGSLVAPHVGAGGPPPTPLDAARRVAAFAADVAVRLGPDGSVGPTITMGLLWKSGRWLRVEYLPPTLATTLTTVRDVERRLRPRTWGTVVARMCARRDGGPDT